VDRSSVTIVHIIMGAFALTAKLKLVLRGLLFSSAIAYIIMGNGGWFGIAGP